LRPEHSQCPSLDAHPEKYTVDSCNSSTEPLENKAPKLIQTHRVWVEADRKTGPIVQDDLLVGPQRDFRTHTLRHAPVPRGEKHTVGAFVPVFFHGDGEVRRLKANVTGGPACVWLDLDDVPAPAWEAIVQHIHGRGWCGEAWSTASYDPASGLVRARLRLNASRTQTPEEIELCRRGLSHELTRVASIACPGHAWKGGHVADTMCFQRVAIFYAPAVYQDRVGTERVWLFDGVADVDVHELVGSVPFQVRTAEKRRAAGARKRVELGLEGDELIEATEAHREAAAAEVEALAARIEACAEGLRQHTELETFVLGRYIAAGLLEETSVRARLRLAAERQRQVHGDRSFPSAEGRYDQIDRGLADGWNEGAALPVTTADEAEVIERAEAEAFGLAGGAAELQNRLEARVPERAYTLTEAETVMREALTTGLAGGATLLWVTAGAGKTHVAAEVMAERAALQRIVFVTQEHALLAEVGALLEARGVDVVHLASPLRLEGTGACTNPDKAALLAATEAGFARHTLCQCEACKVKPRCGAQVYLATSGDVDRALALAGPDAAIIGDEQPELHDVLRPSRAELEWLRDSPRGGPWACVTSTLERVVRELALAWLAGDEPQGVYIPGVLELVDPLAMARKWRGQLQAARQGPVGDLQKHAKRLQTIRNVLRIAAATDAPTVGAEGIAATVMTPVGLALQDRARPRVVMSATPVLGAFLEADGWRVVRVDVGCASGVEIKRTLRYAGRVGRKALCPGKVVDEKAVTAIVWRVLADYPDGSILLCTFKAVADALRPGGPLAHLLEGRDVEVMHYGAVRGKNDTADGRPVASFDHYISVGDPFTGGIDELAADAGQATLDSETWRQHAEAELGQFHARARDVRRVKPAQHSHYGTCVPEGWHAGQNVEVVVGDARLRGAEAQREATAAASSGVYWLGRSETAQRLCVPEQTLKSWLARGSVPVDRVPVLRAMLPDRLGGWMTLLNVRRVRLEKTPNRKAA
jgi:hypothetical protein